MFRGQYEHTIDAKGRVSLPARHREVLAARGADHLFVTIDPDGCLTARDPGEWAAFEARIAAQPTMDPNVRQIRRYFIGNAQEIPVDGSGRILIPPQLRDHADLQREVVFLGNLERIEIWSKARWEANRETVSGEDINGLLATMGI